MTEASIEASCRAYAKARGWEFVKVGQSGWPDRVVVLPGGIHLWLEFKTATGRTTKRQDYRLNALRTLGAHAHVCRSKADFITLCGSILGLALFTA